MKYGDFKKTHWLAIIMFSILVVLFGMAFVAIRYPSKMKKMFIQSSRESLEKQLNDASQYINDNIEMNYEEIKLLSGIISENLDGSEKYSKVVLESMRETMDKAGYNNVGIVRLGSGHLFATMCDGKTVQLDDWVLALNYDTSKVSAELQTSPFCASDNGNDAVVYRYRFQGKDGKEYMLIAEKPQKSLKAMFNLKSNEDGLTLVFRENGNVVYSDGRIEENQIDSYNTFAMLQKLGANSQKIAEVKKLISQKDAGMFILEVDGEPYYFMYHNIKNTNWICLYAYSETVMAGKNLSKVNQETMKLVAFVVLLLGVALIMSVLMVKNSVRKEAETKTLETEKLFEEMSRHIPSAFAILNEKESTPSFISYNFYEVIKVQEFDFRLEGILSWLDMEYDEKTNQELKNGGRFETVIYKNNSYFSIGFYSIGNVNDCVHYVFIVNDITDDMEAKRLLEDSMHRADAMSKSKTQFLSQMSHEIRTPLNSVLGFSRLAIDGWNKLSRDELFDYLNKIQSSGNYLLELVSDTLDISKIEEGRIQIVTAVCSLDSLIDEVVDSFQGQMERKKHQFVVDKNYDDVFLNMDSFHTKQIINNLLSNACKYTDEGGVVGLEVSTKKINDTQMAVKFVIQDTGIGMSQEFVDVIFEPFTQEDRGMLMKQQLRGSGLGMPICKNLVDLQNGTIKVESSIGEGSCFTVVIPYEIANQEHHENVKQKIEQDYSCLKGKKILVVDDVEMNRIFIHKVLDNLEIVYDDATNGEEAVDCFMTSKEGEYFAIFMDVNMPILNGHKATEQIRKLNRKDASTIMIAGMTADAFTDDISKALMSGMNYHVSKPVQIERVIEILLETYAKEAGEQNEY